MAYDYSGLEKQAQDIFSEMLDVLYSSRPELNRTLINPTLLFEGPLLKNRCADGCCESSKDSVYRFQITLNNWSISDPYSTKRVIAHEITHAIAGCRGHGSSFTKELKKLHKLYKIEWQTKMDKIKEAEQNLSFLKNADPENYKIVFDFLMGNLEKKRKRNPKLEYSYQIPNPD